MMTNDPTLPHVLDLVGWILSQPIDSGSEPRSNETKSDEVKK